MKRWAGQMHSTSIIIPWRDWIAMCFASRSLWVTTSSGATPKVALGIGAAHYDSAVEVHKLAFAGPGVDRHPVRRQHLCNHILSESCMRTHLHPGQQQRPAACWQSMSVSCLDGSACHHSSCSYMKIREPTPDAPECVPGWHRLGTDGLNSIRPYISDCHTSSSSACICGLTVPGLGCERLKCSALLARC